MQFLEKPWKNASKQSDIDPPVAETRRNYLVLESNHHITKFFLEYLLAIVMNKMQIRMNKSVCLGFSVLESTKILILEFWHKCVKPNLHEQARLCYIDIDSFFVFIKPQYLT